MDSENNYENPDDSNAHQDRLIGEEFPSFFVGPAYTLAEEEAMDREALDEMARNESLPDENDFEILEEIEVVTTSPRAEPILQPTGAHEFDSDTNSQDIQVDMSLENFGQTLRSPTPFNDDLDERRTSDGIPSSFQPRDMGDTHQLHRFSSMDRATENTNSQSYMPRSLENRYGNVRQHNTPQSYYLSDSRLYMERPGMANGRQERSLSARPVEARNIEMDLRRATAPQATVTTSRNESTRTVIPNSTATSSALSKDSPVVQAAVSARQHVKSIAQNRSSGKGTTSTSSTNNSTSMDAIKEKMDSYLKACNDKLQKKPDRSPHARFLSYLGTKMEKVPKEKIELVENEILRVVFRVSNED